jgi:tetratricopeptide (TPR) repeat protein
VSAKAHARAAELTNEAQAHYDAGRYEEASESYRQAFAVVPAPELLFNLGQCQRLLGRPQRAVKYFQAYLRLRPDAPHRPLVEQLIEENQLLGPNDPAQASARPEPPAISAAPTHGASPEERGAPRVHNANVMPLPPPEPLHHPPPTRLLADSRYTDDESVAVYERWWFWTAIAVVAAGAAVTTYAVVSDQDGQESAPMTTLGMIAWD